MSLMADIHRAISTFTHDDCILALTFNLRGLTQEVRSGDAFESHVYESRGIVFSSSLP